MITFCPTSGEAEPVPWTSGMVLATGSPGGGGVPPPGVGAPEVKSAALSAVLTLVLLRDTDVEFVAAGAAPAPAQSLAEPYPTKSTTCGRSEQASVQVVPGSAS